jgi:hypothetical protein
LKSRPSHVSGAADTHAKHPESRGTVGAGGGAAATVRRSTTEGVRRCGGRAVVRPEPLPPGTGPQAARPGGRRAQGRAHGAERRRLEPVKKL